MCLKAKNCFLHFEFDLFKHLRSLWVSRTSKEEILPDDNSFFIAEIIEIFGFVNTAAPYSDAIDIYFDHIFNALFVTILRYASREWIVRNPVRSSNPETKPVYLDGKHILIWEILRSDCRCIEFDGTESNALGDLLELITAMNKGYFNSIKLLISTTAWLPQFCRRDLMLMHLFICSKCVREYFGGAIENSYLEVMTCAIANNLWANSKKWNAILYRWENRNLG